MKHYESKFKTQKTLMDMIVDWLIETGKGDEKRVKALLMKGDY